MNPLLLAMLAPLLLALLVYISARAAATYKPEPADDIDAALARCRQLMQDSKDI